MKASLSKNLAWTTITFAVTVLTNMAYVPFLVRHIGISAYGLVPLVIEITSYMTILTLGLNSSVGRMLTVALERKEDKEANQIFNTSLLAGIALCVCLTPIGILIWASAPSLINIPPGMERDVRVIFMCAFAALIINTLRTPFAVSTFCRNRFDLRSILSIVDLSVRIGTVVVLFFLENPQLWHVGAGVVLASLTSFAGSVWQWRVLTPSLSIRFKDFCKGALRKMSNTGVWIIMNTIGAMLFVSVDLLIVNRIFGATEAGKYAAALQWSTMLRNLAGVVSGVFTPTMLAFHSRGDNEGLVRYCRKAVRLTGLAVALPVGLVCGLSGPLLNAWLGPSYSGLSPLLFVLVAPLCINLAVLPLFGVQLAADKVKMPAVVLFISGLANLILAVVLAKAGGSMMGVALSGALTLSAKNVIFTPLHVAHILKAPRLVFLREILEAAGLAAAVAAASALLFHVLPFSPRLSLAGAGLGVAILFGMAVGYRNRALLRQKFLAVRGAA